MRLTAVKMVCYVLYVRLAIEMKLSRSGLVDGREGRRMV